MFEHIYKSYMGVYPAMRSLLCVLCFVLCPNALLADEAEIDLAFLSIDELMDIEVTSVGKKPQKLVYTNAAIYVVNQEQIRRSGAVSVPEVLRLVPGVQVARFDANKWAITIRGFNRRFANKLLVMVDGRLVYDTSFAGVFWDVQDMMLEDIERIEVVRGPGATLWGANAVNGVINIITKSAAQTQGLLVPISAGDEARFVGAARYGGQLGQRATYRVYGKYLDHAEALGLDGTAGSDDWRVLRAGFRADWVLSERDNMVVRADLYDGEVGQYALLASLDPPYVEKRQGALPILGGHVLARWERNSSTENQAAVQVYYDHTARDEFLGSQERNTLDLDAQHRFALGARQEIIWGMGYRYSHDKKMPMFPLDINPKSKGENLFNGFLQSDWALAGDRLRLTLGTKVEHNDYTGFEVQPNGRLMWAVNESHNIWASVARATRTPSRIENDIRLIQQVIAPDAPQNFSPLPIAFTVFGDRSVKSEELLALELGYRLVGNEHFSVDVATFYNRYDRLLAPELSGQPVPNLFAVPPHIIARATMGNIVDGAIYGFEITHDWHLHERLFLQTSYSHLQMDLDVGASPLAAIEEGNSPVHQWSLFANSILARSLEFDVWGRYVSRLAGGGVPSYFTLDMRLGWQPMEKVGLSLVGQNLLDAQHGEFIDLSFATQPNQLQRSAYAKIVFRL